MDGGDDGGCSYSNDRGFSSSGGDVDCGSSTGDAGLSNGRGADYNDSFRSNSFDQGKDSHSDWKQGPFATSFDEPENTTYIMDGEMDRKIQEGDDIENSQGIGVIYPVLEAVSILKDSAPNENGDAPMNLLLEDSRDQEESTDVNIDGCQPVDCLYYSLVCCCTIL